MSARLGEVAQGNSPHLVFRVERHIFEKVKKGAEKAGLTLSQYCRQLIEKAVQKS